MFSVSRPMLVVVLKDWVMETKLVPALSSASTSLAKSSKRAGQAVDLVDDDDVDLARCDIGQQALQRRTRQRAAGDAAIVIAVVQQHPAFAGLARHIGRAGTVLRIERVEVLLEPFLARLAGVDGAADRLHEAIALRSPKKAGPDHCWPVMALAMALSEVHSRPFQSILPFSSMVTT